MKEETKIPCSFCGSTDSSTIQSGIIKNRIAAICIKCIKEAKQRLESETVKPNKIMVE